jgi:hypothetical protein
MPVKRSLTQKLLIASLLNHNSTQLGLMEEHHEPGIWLTAVLWQMHKDCLEHIFKP